MEPPQRELLSPGLSPSDTENSPVALPDGKERIPLGSGVITRLLGRGGTAAVYEIWNSHLEIYRAVKLINPNSVDIAHQRFQTEFKICAKLKHPNIVEIHGVGQWRGLPYIEMEKIDGTGLDRIIDRSGALPAAVCTSVGIMICRALDYAHNQECTIYGKCYRGVVHRDLKPQNIMVCGSGTVKLMDFGIARPIDASFKTLDGLISGTLQFLSPEQLEKGTLDFRSDLYSLGVTLYEIVTGVNPFPQTSFANLVSFKTKNKFQPIETFPVQLPRQLKRVIYKCMHYDPAKRVPSAAELLTVLTKIHCSLTSESPEEIMAWLFADTSGKKVILASRRRFPWRQAAAIFAIGVLGFGFYRFGMPNDRKPFFRKAVLTTYGFLSNAFSRFSPRQGSVSSIQNKQAPPVTAAPFATSPHSASFSSQESSLSNKASPSFAAKSKRAKPFLESLKAEYSADNNLAIMEKALQAKNCSTVLAVYDLLNQEQALSSQALIFKLRALDCIGDREQVATFLENTNLNDGEFYLSKAKLAYANKNIPGCRLMLEICLTSPHALIDSDVLKREVYYYGALCATALFDAQPGEQSYKDALDAWWQLKSLLRSEPDHEYNKKAASELQRMAKEMQKG